jgi:ABC-type transport system involved in Fe-S cluster assembly fused permease/ATPase subunit
MLPDDEKFLSYWPSNREQERTSLRPFLVGLSSGFAIGIAVIAVLESGWYERANMEANSIFNYSVLLLSILLIALFMAFVYRKFRWEMQEQRYLELLAAKKRTENTVEKQP